MGFFDQFLTPPAPPPPLSRGHRPEWMKPEAALPAVVPVELVLARSDEAVAAVSTIEAYPTGFEFNLTIISRRAEFDLLQRALHPWPHRRDDFFRFAVVFADGRIATNVDQGQAPPVGPMPDRAMLMPGGGGGGDRRYDMTYWVYPLPPPGRFRSGRRTRSPTHMGPGRDFTSRDIETVHCRSTWQRDIAHESDRFVTYRDARLVCLCIAVYGLIDERSMCG